MIWLLCHVAGVALGLTGTALVAARRPLAGQLAWLPANAGMIAWAASAGDALTTILFVGYMAIAVFGVAAEVRRRACPRRS